MLPRGCGKQRLLRFGKRRQGGRLVDDQVADDDQEDADDPVEDGWPEFDYDSIPYICGHGSCHLGCSAFDACACL